MGSRALDSLAFKAQGKEVLANLLLKTIYYTIKVLVVSSVYILEVHNIIHSLMLSYGIVRKM